MTITSTGNRESYPGNGVTAIFPFPHPFFANTDLVVYEQVVATGVRTTLALTTDYTVSGAGTQTGGSVTRTTPTAIGTNIVIVRAVPYTQGASFPNNTAFDGPTVEAAFDRAVVLCAQVLDAQSRSPTLGAADIDGSGSYDAKSNKITNLTAGTLSSDAINKSQLDAAVITGAGYTPTAASITNVPAGGIASTNVQAALNELDTKKANLASPTFTGTPTLPTGTTGVTQAIGDASTKLATTAFATNTLSTSGPPLIAASIPYYIAGLQIVNNGTTSMDIQAGACTDGNNTHILTNAATFTKTQAAFAAGTGNGGKMSAAAMANNTWYYFYALRKDADGSIEFGFDVSPTAPTAQAGYTSTNYRYIGARKTQSGSTNWDSFTQHGDEVLWNTPPALDVNGAPTSANRTLTTMNVPGVKVKWLGHLSVAPGAATTVVYLTDPSVADVAPNGVSTATPLGTGFANAAAGVDVWTTQVSCWTNTSSQIGIRGVNTNNIQVATLGWTDRRGVPV